MMDRDEKQYEGIPYFKTVGRILRFSAKCAPWEILFCAGIYLRWDFCLLQWYMYGISFWRD